MLVIVWSEDSGPKVFQKIRRVDDIGHGCLVLVKDDLRSGQSVSKVVQVQLQPESGYVPSRISEKDPA